MVERPNFIDSKWFVMEPDNWHLRPNAPKEIVREFEKFMNKHEEYGEKGGLIVR